MATLAVYRGDEFLRRLELRETPIQIGRAAENQLVLEDKDKGVSRTHAEIRYERGHFIVIDLNSQNGVWLGHRRIKRDTLPVGVPLTIGPYRLVLEEPESQPQADVAGEGVPETVDPGVPAEAEPTHLPDERRMSGSTPGTLAAQPLPPKRHVRTMVVVGISAIVLVVAVILGKNAMSRPTPSTPGPPPGPTVEQRFQEKFKLAQAYLKNGDKAAAKKANEEALSIKPGDRKGLDQQQQIAALEAAVLPPPEPAPPPAPDPEPPKEVRSRPQDSLTVAPRKGESAANRAIRDKLARSHLEDGRARFREGNYPAAIVLLEAALRTSEREDYGRTAFEARQLIGQAREKVEEQEREEKAKRIEDQLALAQQRDDAGDIVGAMRALLEVKRLDPARPAVDDRISTLQERARTEGDKAFTDARNYDARRGRSKEALNSFDRAVQLFELVPGGSPNLEYARQRRDELRAQQ